MTNDKCALPLLREDMRECTVCGVPSFGKEERISRTVTAERDPRWVDYGLQRCKLEPICATVNGK